MIELKMKKEALIGMYFDDIKGGKSSFTDDGIATITDREFADFLRTNNLITYHNMLKTYEDGEIQGEFTQG
ncbi:MAG TPA: hypothetical protein VJ824_01570 [Bacillota bacterium]|nr:hypothetical protein [Bacillota bacterium]